MRLSIHPFIQFSQLIDCPIWDHSTGQLLGAVKQVWLDKQLHQVLGLAYQSLLTPSEVRSLPWEQVVAVSSEGVWINVSENTTLILQPMSSIHYQLDEDVWTETDSLLGTLIDYVFETITGAVHQYQCALSKYQGGWPQLLDISAVDLHHRRDRWQIKHNTKSQLSKQPSQHQPQEHQDHWLNQRLGV